jgi:hypothetical protein
VSGQPTTVNLLDWSNGNAMVLGSAEMPPGDYTQIRLIIDQAQVLVDGETYDIAVPSGARTGLKLGPAFTINEGSTYELVVDFDAHRSVIATGPPGSPNGYQLKPRLRAVPKAVTGSISGTVTNPAHLPIAHAIAGEDTVTSAAVDTTDGSFLLAFLEAGSYTVAVRDTLALSFLATDVQIAVGTSTPLGVLALE